MTNLNLFGQTVIHEGKPKERFGRGHACAYHKTSVYFRPAAITLLPDLMLNHRLDD